MSWREHLRWFLLAQSPFALEWEMYRLRMAMLDSVLIAVAQQPKKEKSWTRK